MAIRLFAHMLRGAAAAADGQPGTAVAQRPLDFGRWIFGELVVRRREPFSTTLPPPMPAPTRRRLDAAAGDSTWADTQPWYHG